MKPVSTTRGRVPAPPDDDLGGGNVIDLSGEYSHYTVPKPVAEAVIHAAETTDLGRLTQVGGRPLREAIRRKLARCNGLEVDADWLTLTSGGNAGLGLAIATLADPGDVILLPDPGWTGYRRLALAWDCRAVTYPLTGAGEPDYAALEPLLEPACKALLLSTPSNPAGAVLSAAALQRVMEFARAHDLFVICDESCDLLRYDRQLAEGPLRYDTDGRALSVFSFSKTHAMAGLRLGYNVAAPWLTAAVRHTQAILGSGPSSLAVVAGEAALEMDEAVVESMVSFYTQQRDILQAVLPSHYLPHPPQGGFHALLDISSTRLSDADAFRTQLLRDEGLLVASGHCFGERSAHCVRLTLAARERVFGRAIERLLRFLEAHA